MKLHGDFDCEQEECEYRIRKPEDLAVILAALYNGAHYQHRYFSGSSDHVMTVEEARELLKTQTNFDYVNGRPLKVDLSENLQTLNLVLYNRDNGCGRGPKVIRAVIPETQEIGQ